MAQTRRTFFDLGAAERIADPAEEEAARRRALEIQELQRQDALRAAVAGEGLQREQLQSSQQQAMAKLGMDGQRLGFDRDKLAQSLMLDREHMEAAQAEAGMGREFDAGESALDRALKGTMQKDLFGQQNSLQEALMGHQTSEGAARDQAAWGRQIGSDGTKRELAAAALEQERGLRNAESQRREQREARAERVRLKELEEKLDRDAAERDQRNEREIRESNRRSRAAKEREATTRQRDADTKKYRGEVREDAKKARDDKTDAGKKALAQEGKARLESFLSDVDLNDESTIQRLKDLAQLDPNVRAALEDPSIKGWLTGKLRKMQWKDADSAGGAFRRQMRVEGKHWLPKGWVDSQEDANEKQMDRLRDALRLR